MFVTDYTMHLLDHVKKIHFIGCGGSGMYPLIQILSAKGYDISGSDVLDGSIIRSEREMGVKVSLGHAADNVIGVDLVVYSAAIAKDNVELNAAASYGIPTVERSVLLGYVSRLYKDSICVSGTHGKTTTTSMITTALELAGRDPSAVIGGKLPLIGGYGKAGKGDDIVIEACEFSETFLKLTPYMSVVLNIDNDHLDYYGSMGELLTEQFRTKLDEGWAQIQADIQTDALGAIETLATALKDGDLESLGLWAASYFWQACTKEQQTQINSIALGALNQLGSALSGVFGNLSQMAMGLVAQFVPAAASATAGQTALNVAMDANPILFVISLIGMLVGALINFSGTNKNVANGFQSVWAGVEDFMSYIFEGLMRIVAAGIEGFVILINGLIGLYNSVAWLYGGTIDYISNPAWDYANKIAADRKARQEARKKQQEAINNPSSSGTSTNSQKVIESMTDTSKTTRADGSTVTTKVLTEKLQDETGKITQRVTKTVTEAGTKLVDGVERSYKTVTTYVDGVQTKLERSLDDIAKTTTGTKPGSTTPTAPTPDKDLTDAVEANTEALLAANSKLAEMVRQANSLVLSDNMAISRSVAASGTAQVAAAANNYHREGDTNIIQNIYSKAQTAADLQREARWEADRAKAQKR